MKFTITDMETVQFTWDKEPETFRIDGMPYLCIVMLEERNETYMLFSDGFSLQAARLAGEQSLDLTVEKRIVTALMAKMAQEVNLQEELEDSLFQIR